MKGNEMKFPEYVAHVDDERAEGNSIIITLADGWFFADEPDCGVKGFDTMSEAREAVKRKNIISAAQKRPAAV